MEPYRVIATSGWNLYFNEDPYVVYQLDGLVKHILPFHITLRNCEDIVLLCLLDQCLWKFKKKTVTLHFYIVLTTSYE